MSKGLKQYFSIPNLLGYFRLLLVPVYLYLYLNAETNVDYYAAGFVILISYISDYIDGRIARRYNMITDFGKILDPIADKVTQAAMAFSFTFRYPAIKLFLGVLIVKEFIMGTVGLYAIKKGHEVTSAQNHGKLCTVVINASMFIILVFPSVSLGLVNTLIALSIIAMALSLVLYLRMYIGVLKEAN